MLHKAMTLAGYRFACLDGEIGKVKEHFFDDHHWAIRYIVADTGEWLSFREVLLSPHAVLALNTEKQSIAVSLTKKQIEDSPEWDSEKPVSRQFEDTYYGHYGWPTYWNGPLMWGDYLYPARDRDKLMKTIQHEKAWDPHLRSTHDVAGHHIQATDGEIGHVEDYVIDDETWAIRYLIIDTRNWWPGKRVLVSTQWIERVSWPERKVFVDLSREAIKTSPEYRHDSPLTRDYEIKLHQHYNRKGYWIA
jgi:hypothetical protein